MHLSTLIFFFICLFHTNTRSFTFYGLITSTSSNPALPSISSLIFSHHLGPTLSVIWTFLLYPLSPAPFSTLTISCFLNFYCAYCTYITGGGPYRFASPCLFLHLCTSRVFLLSFSISMSIKVRLHPLLLFSSSFTVYVLSFGPLTQLLFYCLCLSNYGRLLWIDPAPFDSFLFFLPVLLCLVKPYCSADPKYVRTLESSARC